MSSLLLLLLQLVTFALIARAILSWFRPEPGSALFQIRGVVEQLTDPLVLPVRRMLPNMGGIDLSIFAIIIVINFFLVPLVASF